MRLDHIKILQIPLISIGILLTFSAIGQSLRTSVFQYQFNQLTLNPAYASRLSNPGFEAIYVGNFASENQISRSVIVNGQGPTKLGGIGASLQFFQNAFWSELTFRPAYAFSFSLPNGGELSFGASIGFNYFDVDETVLSNLQDDFISFDAGAGVFYHRRAFFLGLSVLNLIEMSSGISDDFGSPSFGRENPYSLHVGTVFRLLDDVEIKPSMILSYINLYELPDQSFGSIAQDFSYDLQLSAFVQNIYVISLMYGGRDVEFGQEQERFGISATYLMGNLRLSYAIQLNNQRNSNISLPASHLLSVGYDLFPAAEEMPVRYF